MTVFTQIMMHLFETTFVVSVCSMLVFSLANDDKTYNAQCGLSYLAVIASIAGIAITWIWS